MNLVFRIIESNGKSPDTKILVVNHEFASDRIISQGTNNADIMFEVVSEMNITDRIYLVLD